MARATRGDQDRLERACRLLLRFYPRAYRLERGEEILATLLDTTAPGRRAPLLADAADVVLAGLRLRLGTPTMAGFDAGLRVAAPIALTVAAGISAFAWWRVEPVGTAALGVPPFLGAFRTVGPIAYLAWLVAAVARVVFPAVVARAGLGVALATTLLLPAVTAVTPYDRPPLWVIMALAVFGALALAGTSSAARASLDERVSIGAGTIGVAVLSSGLVVAWPPAGGGLGYYYQPTLSRVGAVVAVTVGAVAVTAAVRLVRADRASAQPWLWATALLGLPAGWLGPFDSAGLRLAADVSVPHFGRLAQVLLATGVAAVAIAGLAERRTTNPVKPRVSRLALTGAATVGAAAGLAGFLLLGARGLFGFVGGTRDGSLPGEVALTLVALVVAGAFGVATARPTRAGWLAFAGGAVTAFPTAWVVAAYDNGWTPGGWLDFPHTAALVVTVAFLPFAACVVAALGRPAVPGARVGAVGMLVVSLGWVAYAAVPSVLSWGPVVLVLLSGCAVLGLNAARRSPRAL